MILAIVGMHRSGTSLAAAWLHSCGLVLDDGKLIQPYLDNPKGFFEDADFVELHAKSILRRTRQSAGWKVAPASPLTFSASELQVAQAIISVRQNHHASWGWKDPRTTLFLTQWKCLIPQLKVIVVWRPCGQVVLSLMRRWWKSKTRKHYLDPAGFIRLWKAHNRLACHFASCYPDDVVVLPIEQIIGQDQKVLNYLNQRFGIALRYNPIGSIYDPESFHHQPAPVVLDHLFALFGCQQVEDYLLAQKPPLDKA